MIKEKFNEICNKYGVDYENILELVPFYENEISNRSLEWYFENNRIEVKDGSIALINLDNEDLSSDVFVSRIFEYIDNLKLLNIEGFPNSEIKRLMEEKGMMQVIGGFWITENAYNELSEISKKYGLSDDNVLELSPFLEVGIRAGKDIEYYLGGIKIKVENGSINSLIIDSGGLGNVKIFPNSFCYLTNLEELTIGGGYIEILPESLGLLRNLKRLYIRGNKLTSLPESICDLINLEELWIGNNFYTKREHENKISELPENMGNLSKLRVFYADNNNLSSLPKSMGKLSKMRSLSILGNNFSLVPEVIRNYKELEDLYMSCNGITEIPEWLFSEMNLEQLTGGKNPAFTKYERHGFGELGWTSDGWWVSKKYYETRLSGCANSFITTPITEIQA